MTSQFYRSKAKISFSKLASRIRQDFPHPRGLGEVLDSSSCQVFLLGSWGTSGTSLSSAPRDMSPGVTFLLPVLKLHIKAYTLLSGLFVLDDVFLSRDWKEGAHLVSYRLAAVSLPLLRSERATPRKDCERGENSLALTCWADPMRILRRHCHLQMKA